MATDPHPGWVLTTEERLCVVRQQIVVDRLSSGASRFVTVDERQDMRMAVAICRGMGGDDDVWVADFLEGIVDGMVLVPA